LTLGQPTETETVIPPLELGTSHDFVRALFKTALADERREEEI
jgi:hypothetical protein